MKTPSRALPLLTLVACMGELPPPPSLLVTSPERGMIESEATQVLVEGRATPGSDGSPVTQILVAGKPAKVNGDGSFSATVDIPEGAMMLETIAISAEGGKATDARAIHIGQRRQVGTKIDRAVGLALSADTFAQISAMASQILSTTDFSTLLQPISVGGGTANAKVTVRQLAFGGVQIALTPVDGGLMLNLEIDGLDAAANVAYAGSLVPDGSTNVTVTADKIAVGGVLQLTPDGTTMKATVASPSISSTALKLNATGLIGTILDLVQNNLSSVIGGFAKGAVEKAMGPLINKALGAIEGPKSLDVMGKTLTLDGSFGDAQFTSEGALVFLNISAAIAGGEASPGYIYNPNGMPSLDLGAGIQVALADDLLNDAFAQVHALGVLDLGLQKDFGLFDSAKLELTMAPMMSANTQDGTVRLVLGDMIVTVADGGKQLVRAAVNAQVDVKVDPTETSAIKIGLETAKVVVNLLDAPTDDSELAAQLQQASKSGIGLQIEKLDDIVVNLPIPSFQGAMISGLGLHGDSGYVVASGQLQSSAAP